MITLDRPVEVPEFMPDWAPFEGEDVWLIHADWPSRKRVRKTGEKVKFYQSESCKAKNNVCGSQTMPGVISFIGFEAGQVRYTVLWGHSFSIPEDYILGVV